MIVYFKWGTHYIHTIYDQHLDILIPRVQKKCKLEVEEKLDASSEKSKKFKLILLLSAGCYSKLIIPTLIICFSLTINVDIIYFAMLYISTLHLVCH